MKLAEELVKEVSETEKGGIIHLLVPSSELGLVRGKLDCNTGDERPVATRLESLEDLVKGVVERLTRMEANQERQVRTQPQAVPQVQTGVQPQAHIQNYAAVAAAGLSVVPKQVQQLLSSRQRRTSTRTLLATWRRIPWSLCSRSWQSPSWRRRELRAP